MQNQIIKIGTDNLQGEKPSISAAKAYAVCGKLKRMMKAEAVVNYETKYSDFQQASENTYFGNSFLSETHDKANLKTTYNQLSAAFANRLLGSLKGYVGFYNYNYCLFLLHFIFKRTFIVLNWVNFFCNYISTSTFFFYWFVLE